MDEQRMASVSESRHPRALNYLRQRRAPARFVGVNCDFEATGESEQEVLQKCAEHAKSAHRMDEIPLRTGCEGASRHSRRRLKARLCLNLAEEQAATPKHERPFWKELTDVG